ncbi:hypothetical protein RHSIM_Rhsim01G0178100 [Rhododendron simsii]|uniref:Uncharacterized protein n=1 Tax=Rhododendron simsii TaxID=118357 RepID=A0A834HHG6_RHOSS|nr:hypothetical protein RHSIM_Rhsim01G0178100 [Rhododendron simsii]
MGAEQQRFVVPVMYLNHPLFMHLLKEAEEEYGFDQKGTITIPCRVEEFRYVQGLIDKEHHHVGCFRAKKSVQPLFPSLIPRRWDVKEFSATAFMRNESTSIFFASFAASSGILSAFSSVEMLSLTDLFSLRSCILCLYL